MFKWKFVFLGDAKVGKSAISGRYVSGNSFDWKLLESTKGLDFLIKDIIIESEHLKYEIKLTIWDTSGEFQYKNMQPNYIKDCSAAFIFCDITNKESFANLIKHQQKIKQHAVQALIFLIANKSDLEAERVVSNKQLEEFSKEHNLNGWALVSAKDEESLSTIENIFLKAANQLFELNPPLKITTPQPAKNSIKLTHRLWQQIQQHPYRTGLALFLLFTVMALFFIPGVGQFFGLAGFIGLGIAKIAGLGMSTALATGLLASVISLSAVTAPVWFGKGCDLLGRGLQVVGELLSQPGESWMKWVDKKSPPLENPKTNFFYGTVLGAILMFLTGGSPLYVLGVVLEKLGKTIFGDQPYDTRPADKTSKEAAKEYRHLESAKIYLDERIERITCCCSYSKMQKKLTIHSEYADNNSPLVEEKTTQCQNQKSHKVVSQEPVLTLIPNSAESSFIPPAKAP